MIEESPGVLRERDNPREEAESWLLNAALQGARIGDSVKKARDKMTRKRALSGHQPTSF